MSIEMKSADIAIREWHRAWVGKEPTANVLDSGIPIMTASRPQGKLLLIDLQDGVKELSGGLSVRRLQVSPGGTYISFETVSALSQPTAGVNVYTALTAGQHAIRTGIVDSNGSRINLSFAGRKDILEFARPSSLRWSADGSQVAFLENATAQTDGGTLPRLLSCQIASRICQEATSTQLEPIGAKTDSNEEGSPFVWSAKGDLLINGRLRAKTSAKGDRYDWWLAKTKDETVNLTSSLRSVPETLYPETKRHSVIGIADGQLLRISLDGLATARIGTEPAGELTSIVWPLEGTPETRSVSQIIVGAGSSGALALYRVHLETGQVEQLPKPSIKSPMKYWFWAFAPASGVALFLGVEPHGNSLWLWQSTSRNLAQIADTNSFLRDITSAEKLKFGYRSLDGQTLNGWIVLPAGYQKGRRYPLIAKVYAEQLADDVFPVGLGDPSFELLAAHGYAVLLPSMPLGPWGQPSDPLLQLTSGVLPAVDKAIELGIADPDRLGLIGHSYGGYSVYGLITQTNRFKAAVSLAGISDLVSLYGEFDARERYTNDAHENLFRMWNAEGGQGRMGGPPWTDFGRYLRNSPIFYAAQVQTPLMIIQGDMDYLGIQQGEEFFTALYRQGKRARFVRYWGEGHVIQSPANVVDMWDRLFDWFDSLLKPIPRRGARAQKR
jgi:dipeptidyl aminopeptidase/acylaminoacyl peptidase